MTPGVTCPRCHNPILRTSAVKTVLIVLVWLDAVCAAAMQGEGAPPVLLALPGPLFPRADFSPPTQGCAAAGALLLHIPSLVPQGLKSCSLASHRRAGRAVRDQWHAAVSRGKAGRLHVSRGADGGKRVGLLADAGQVCGKARSTFPRHDGARTRSSFSALAIASDICSSSSTSCSLTRPSPVRTLSVSPTCLQARLSTCMT
jgi:hypothetical protein